jgi:hypothetical protein
MTKRRRRWSPEDKARILAAHLWADFDGSLEAIFDL